MNTRIMITMKNKIMIIALRALLLLASTPVQALTITMSNPDATMEKDIMVYQANVTDVWMYGLYNTTSIIDIDSNYSYLFVLKPQYSNPLDEPITWLENTFSYVSTNIIPIIIIVFLIGLLLSRRRS